MPKGCITKESGPLVLLMGQTGAGKSTFINAAAGQLVATVNYSLTSVRLDIDVHTVKNPNGDISVTFLEAPGFNHYSRSDHEILKHISRWLRDSCSPDASLGGIVYLHDSKITKINNDGILGLVGYIRRPEPFAHLLLAIGKLAIDSPDATRRAEELESLVEVKGLGTRTTRFTGSTESAWSIISALPLSAPLKVQVLCDDFDRICGGLKVAKKPSAIGRFVRKLFR